ncbi:MAG: glycosyltransferase family 4 protein [Anaerolineales bacterium]|nr:glycosyltransferase family 4 protein [Anaerolineales bacterium]
MKRTFLNVLKRLFPFFFRVVFGLRDWVKSIPAWIQLSVLQKSGDGIAVSYLSSRFPKPPISRNEFAHGGAVKLTYLAENFPHHFPVANLLYAVSSVAHPLQMEILQTAKHKELQIVVNQNGVAFPAWDGANYEASNRPLKRIIAFADFIIYQSQFCKDSAERYISPPTVPHEIIYNPVDTRLFSPEACPARPAALTLLLGGNQYEKYRLELALQTLKAIHRDVPNAKLIVTGNLWLPRHEAEAWTTQALHEMQLTEHVTFTGTYAQKDAPALYSQAHLLLHTKYADPSPGLVLEAMALGMPVVYLNNGGVPELVGDAGIGVHVEHDWDRINLPNPQAMADMVMQIYVRREEFSQKARQRAADLFSLEKFVERHKEIFEKVLGDSHL